MEKNATIRLANPSSNSSFTKSVIVELQVENLAIIDRAKLAFGPGFTILTGETGAGKSLIIDALELAFGARADSESVRQGAARALVHMTLDLTARPDIAAACRDIGIMFGDELITIQREVMAEGRSSCRINGKLTPVNVLRAVGSLIVDLHGQHDHQSLLRPEEHAGFLDAWIGEPANRLLSEVRMELGSMREASARLSSVRRSSRDREQRLDLLRYQIQEIESASPVDGEFESLEAELGRRENSERFRANVFESNELLFEKEDSASNLIRAAHRMISDMAELDPELVPLRKRLEEALFALEDLPHELSRYADSLDANPQRLEEVADRLDQLRTLRRKYGADENAVLAHLAQAQAELSDLESEEFSEADLSGRFEEARARLNSTCARLTELRTSASVEFSRLVESQLHDLSMERAEFEVRFGQKEPDETGADALEFEFSANAGESKRALAKIASGGELSRVMLALKSIMAGKVGVPVLIFDEVDAGLGGQAAAVLARKLDELSANHQVIVISHLPQIAGRASGHFRISKSTVGDRVVTKVEPLAESERIEEIARMIAGEHVTEAARANARELMRTGMVAGDMNVL